MVTRSRSRIRGPLLLTLALSASMAAVIPHGASAREPAFIADHFELRSLDATRLSFSGYHRSPLPPRQHVDADGSPMRRWGDRWVYPTGGLSMTGMSRIVAWQVTGDRRQLRQALTQAATLRRIAIRADGAWWLPHDFDYGAEGMRAPWFNAMTQGLALSFFIRLYQVTGDRTHLAAAEAVFRSFERVGRGHRRWVAYTDDDRHLWLEHYPSGRPDHVLNAHLHAVFGLYEYWNETGSPSARRLLEGAITTMRDRLDDFRRPGGVSLYCLYHRTRHLHYHAIHVWQIRLLGRISGDSWFLRMSRLLRQDAGFSRPGRGAPGWPHPATPRVQDGVTAQETPAGWVVLDVRSSESLAEVAGAIPGSRR